MAYAVIGDISARLPGRTFSATSKPTTSQVEGWIAETEAALDGALAGAGMSVPFTDASAVLILKSWVGECVEGRVRMAHASLGGDASNEDGKDMVERFFSRLDDIDAHASRYSAMLSAGAASTATVKVRGSNADGLIEPIFTRDEAW